MVFPCHPSFCFHILDAYADCLRVPALFALHIRQVFAGPVNLRGLRGRIWVVILARIEASGEVLFDGGWPEFLTDHMVTNGDFRVFTYLSGVDFKIKALVLRCLTVSVRSRVTRVIRRSGGGGAFAFHLCASFCAGGILADVFRCGAQPFVIKAASVGSSDASDSASGSSGCSSAGSSAISGTASAASRVAGVGFGTTGASSTGFSSVSTLLAVASGACAGGLDDSSDTAGIVGVTGDAAVGSGACGACGACVGSSDDSSGAAGVVGVVGDAAAGSGGFGDSSCNAGGGGVVPANTEDLKDGNAKTQYIV
ncbi:hypothetical protein J5N97_022369 [Dioscorea zingiberensis]|uniref:TF-B3 domain-containing protein n=1 Tax=Dioscorea zingiberensis TaxID=325984 RepID=A0A9D5CBE4_9LILI|nr:hypothetical protein J5N97_022369 [Dioscorea zingiberensis]